MSKDVTEHPGSVEFIDFKVLLTYLFYNKSKKDEVSLYCTVPVPCHKQGYQVTMGRITVVLQRV